MKWFEGDGKRWVERLPKAELHLHFEGAFRWQTIREIHPEGAKLPEVPPWLAENGFADFADFRRIFTEFVEPTTGRPEWVERHMHDVLADLAAQNVTYAEINVGLALHMSRGLSLDELFEAIDRGKQAAQREFGIVCGVILGIRRYEPAEVAREKLVQALEVAGPNGTGVIVGVDLQGDERQGPPENHVEAYRLAKDAGLRLKAHAGELLGPQCVRATVDLLGVDHLSHGVRACEDPALLAELVAKGVYFHVCPTSNFALKVVPSLAECHLRPLVDAGAKVTINSDDPLLFGASITDEYFVAAREMAFTPAELVACTRCALDAALVPEKLRQSWLAELDGLAAEMPEA